MAKRKTKPMTAAERVRRSEQRKKDAGLVKCWAWVYPEDRQAMREHASYLRLARDLETTDGSSD